MCVCVYMYYIYVYEYIEIYVYVPNLSTVPLLHLTKLAVTPQ